MHSLGRRRFLQVGLGAGALLAGGFAALERSSRPLVETRRRGQALGTTLDFCVLHDDAAVGAQAIDAALAAVDRVEDVMSVYRATSALSTLNRDGVLNDPHPWLVAVLQHARALSAATDGAFDVTVQPLWRCWSQAAKENRLPTDAELAAARRLVDWRGVHVSPRRVTLGRPGMQITLNGIGQGFAADQAVAALRNCGVAHALVNTGEVRSLGTKHGAAWTVGVQHPRVADAYAALARCDGRALSTSGDYATTFTPDRRHHHILDPRRGRSPDELASVTVAAETGLAADALSTALLVLGADRGRELLAKLPNTDALLLFKDGRRLTTPGFPEEAVS